MSVYHQMGEKCHGLIHEPDLGRFRGAILSPVNDDQSVANTLIQRARQHTGYEIIFDPQLYVPRSNRGKLPSWNYFPSDVDTADPSSMPWWEGLVNNLVATCGAMQTTALCSPAYVPNRFDNAYYDMMVRVGSYMVTQLAGTGIRPLQTAIVGFGELSSRGRALEIASILSRTRAEHIYLVLVGDTHPRRELADPEQIKGAMRLVAALEAADLPVLVGFSSYDMVLWKAAGATSCATGKYFNLRRFTRSRFEEPTGGGSQLGYWFEEGLMGLLRESDLLRIRERGGFCDASIRNPYGTQILHQLDTAPGTPWVGLGWRQYLFGFSDLEERITAGQADVRTLLRSADEAWRDLDDAEVLMEERNNDGAWIRAWRRALAEYLRH